MTQMTTGQARIVDPVLTTHAAGYARPGNVGSALFPRVEVGQRAGKVVAFGKEGFRRYNTKRAPGEAIKRVQFGYEAGNYAIVDSALEAVVPDEIGQEAAAVPHINASQDAVDLVLDVMELEHECECADIARNAANYDNDHKVALVGANRWRGASGDPTANIEAAKEAIRSSIGVRPNTLLLSSAAYSALKVNAKIIDYLKHLGKEVLTVDLLKSMWEIPNIVVGEAVSASGQDDDLGDVWGADAILAFVAPASGGTRRNAAKPSYGYTYSLRGEPSVRMPYREENRLSWIHQVTNNRTPQLTGMVAGYLIQNAGASPT
ncbi:MAG: hypothetical protein WA956_05605 [Stenotrophomonas sp.]